MSSLGGGRDSNISVVAGTGTGSPCGVCKFLRRKCAAECIFAPYFSSDQGLARFAAIHKVFGASNISKMLMHLPAVDRCEAIVTIAYEAHARIRDPVYGCVAHIFALQQQVAYLQGQLMHARAQLLAQNVVENGRYSLENFASPKSSLDSIECRSFDDVITRDVLVPSLGGRAGDEYLSKFQENYRNDPNNCEFGELHSLAFRMMCHESRDIFLGEFSG